MWQCKTIDRLVALAVLTPIVDSMGGNAVGQTLPVAVRALAVKELTAASSRPSPTAPAAMPPNR